MLDGLERVPWRELHHAYGTAEDVPDLIRDLVAGDRERQKVALYELFGNIWHQGTVYEATSHAVPYLVEIALHPNTDPGTRDGVVGLLLASRTAPRISTCTDTYWRRPSMRETSSKSFAGFARRMRPCDDAYLTFSRHSPSIGIRVPRSQLQS